MKLAITSICVREVTNPTFDSNNSVMKWRRVVTVQRMRFVRSQEISQRSIRPLFIEDQGEIYAMTLTVKLKNSYDPGLQMYSELQSPS